MRVRLAGAAHATRARVARTGRIGRCRTIGRSEDGKLFGKPGGPATRTLGRFPVFRTHQDFAVRFALLAMKLIDRHGRIVEEGERNLKSRGGDAPGRRIYYFT